jgi:7-cyano-7-deazaguanine synthase
VSNNIAGKRVDCMVIFSGGQDSTTSLYWAREKFKGVHAITFDYGQRHKIEIECAKKIAQLAGLQSHDIIDVAGILKTTSPLVDFSHEVGQYNSVDELPGGIEPTFIPCRNILFLTIAANRAVVKSITDLVIGVSAIDYGGYPDCRPEYYEQMAKALFEGSKLGAQYKKPINIETPILLKTKTEIVKMAMELKAPLEYTWSCYEGGEFPCGKCDSCILRAKGFAEAGYEDPLILRLEKAGRSAKGK